MHISIPGHIFLNFCATTQNWMATIALPHCPLPSGSSFLELDYREEQTIVMIIKLQWCLTQTWCQNWWCITTMTHRCSWLRLMVASTGEVDRCSIKKGLSSISALCLLPTKTISFISSPGLRWRRGRLSRWCNFITQLAMDQMFPRRSIDVGTKSKSFVLISKTSHNFVFSSPVILFVQLLTKCWLWSINHWVV